MNYCILSLLVFFLYFNITHAVDSTGKSVGRFSGTHLAAVNDKIGNYTDDERNRKRCNRKNRAAGYRVVTEIKGKTADARNENRTDNEQILAVAQINLLEHLKT